MAAREHGSARRLLVVVTSSASPAGGTRRRTWSSSCSTRCGPTISRSTAIRAPPRRRSRCWLATR